MNKIDKDLLDILVCPVTKDKLLLDEKNNELISKEANLAYPIRAVAYTHLTLPTICSV